MIQTNDCVDQAILVDYLYEEADRETRQRVDAHLRVCEHCANELHTLQGLRGTLHAWAPPKPALGFRVVSETEVPRTPGLVAGSTSWRPVWGLAVAAVLVVAVATAIVRPEIEVGWGGLVVRVPGWAPDATEPPRERAVSASPIERVGTGNRETPVSSPSGVGTAPGTDVRFGATWSASEEAWLQTVRELIRESEQRQTSLLFDRVQAVEQRVAEQRQTDLSEMERTFREVDAEDAEFAKRQLLEYMRRISDQR